MLHDIESAVCNSQYETTIDTSYACHPKLYASCRVNLFVQSCRVLAHPMSLSQQM
jgi:hypothetical protein